MRILICLLLAAATLPALAEVYRWVDDKGVVHYTDKPPASSAKPVELPKLQTYAPGTVTGPQAVNPDQPASAVPAPTIAIATPAAEETIRDADGKISMVVATSLEQGQGVVYYLDGKAQNDAPTPSTGFLLSGVDRGEHQLGAAVVGVDGRELARATPVTVYVKPSVDRPAPAFRPPPTPRPAPAPTPRS